MPGASLSVFEGILGAHQFPFNRFRAGAPRPGLVSDDQFPLPLPLLPGPIPHNSLLDLYFI